MLISRQRPLVTREPCHSSIHALPARGCAHDQPRGEENAHRRTVVFLLDDVQGQAGDAFTEAGSILIQAGKRDPKEIVIVDVSAADHGDILGHIQSGFENGAESTHGQWVVAAEYAVGPWIQLQKVLHGPVTASVRLVVSASMFGDIAWRKAQTMFRKCRGVA